MPSPELEKTVPIGTKEELPNAISEEFHNISQPHEDIHMAVSSDMNLEGDFEDCWLLVTDRRILVFSSSNHERPRLVHDVPIADINEVKLRNYVGNGILEVRTSNT